MCAQGDPVISLGRQAHRSRVGEAAEHVLDFALAIDPQAARYRLVEGAQRFPRLAAWTPECRYEATGSRGEAEVGETVSQAGDAVVAIIAALWADGLVPSWCLT